MAESTETDRKIKRWALGCGALVVLFIALTIVLFVVTDDSADIEAGEDACVDEVAAQYDERGESDALPFAVKDETRIEGGDVYVIVGAVRDEGAEWICRATKGDDGIWTAEATP